MSFEIHSFDTDRAAKDFVRERVDTPIPERIQDLGRGMVLRSYTEELDEGTFTNVYDLSFRAESVHPSVELYNQLLVFLITLKTTLMYELRRAAVFSSWPTRRVLCRGNSD